MAPSLQFLQCLTIHHLTELVQLHADHLAPLADEDHGPGVPAGGRLGPYILYLLRWNSAILSQTAFDVLNVYCPL